MSRALPRNIGLPRITDPEEIYRRTVNSILRNLYLDLNIDLDFLDTNLRHGIQASGALSFNDTTHVLTMASGSNIYWVSGEPYSTTNAITCDIDTYETLAANTLYKFYFDSADGVLKAGTGDLDFYTEVWVAFVFWNGINGIIFQETHDYRVSSTFHQWAHRTVGTRYYSGFGLTLPNAANDDSLQIEAGILYDEDLQITTTQQTTIRGFHKVSANVYTYANYSTPYVGTLGQPQYLDTDTYTLTTPAANKYVCYWVYGTSEITRPIHVIPTHAANPYDNLLTARAENPPALIGLNMAPEMKLLYRLIYKGDGEFQESEDFRTSGSLPYGGINTQTADQVSFAPYNSITSTTVQKAFEEIEYLHEDIYESSDDLYITNPTLDKDIIVQINDGGVPTEVLRVDGDVSRVGIGEPAPLGKLHVRQTDTGGSPAVAGTEFIIENTTAADMQFITDNSGASTIYFGRVADADAGVLSYLHNFLGLGIKVLALGSTENAIVNVYNSLGGIQIDASGNFTYPYDTTKFQIGDSQDLSMFISSDNAYIENSTQDKDVIFRVNDGGVMSEVARCVGTTHDFQVANGATGTYTTHDEKIVTVSNGIITNIADTSLCYDTGWINRSDWTNVHMGSNTTKNSDSNVSHNLGANLSDLIVNVLISTDGTEANSFMCGNYMVFNPTASTKYGYTLFQVDTNTIQVQTGASGLVYLNSNGNLITIVSDDIYYKIKVVKSPGSKPSASPSSSPSASISSSPSSSPSASVSSSPSASPSASPS